MEALRAAVLNLIVQSRYTVIGLFWLFSRILAGFLFQRLNDFLKFGGVLGDRIFFGKVSVAGQMSDTSGSVHRVN